MNWPVEADANQARERCVLIIDDDPHLLRLMGLAFERRGDRVALAQDGCEGLAAFEAMKPDLVVTDLVMPGREGIETIIAIKRLDPAVKIIAVSGGGHFGTTDYLNLATGVGADMVLTKPFRMASLVAVADELLAPALAVAASL